MIRHRGGYWQVRVYAGLDPISGRKRHVYDRATSQVAARALEARLRADLRRQRTSPHRRTAAGPLAGLGRARP